MTVRLGVIGPGAIAERHAEALAAAGCRVTAVAGPNQTRARQFAEVHCRGGGDPPAVYASATELYAHPGLSGVVIASPHTCHADQAVAAVQAGLHVLCEIPVGVSLREVEAVARAAAETGRSVAVAHTLRFCRPYLAVRELIETGELRVRHLVARSHMLRQTDTGMDGRRRTWTDDLLWHHGAHTLDAAMWLLAAVDVTVHGGHGPPWPGSGKPMDAGAVLLASDGGLATISLSYHARAGARDMTVIAEDRTLRLADGRLYDAGDVLVDCGDGDQMERDGLLRQDRDFVTAISQGRRPACTVEDILPAMRVLDRLASNGPPGGVR